MPAPQLFHSDHQLRTLTLRLDDLTLDLVNGVRTTVAVEFDDGLKATVLSRVFADDLAGNLPDEARSLVEAFLWGDQARGVVAWCQRLDRSAMSRRVRSTL